VSRVLLVTANAGGFDKVYALPPTERLDSVYYSDEGHHPHGWDRGAVLPRYSPARLRAKWPKCQIHRLPEAVGYSHLAWADASFRFSSVGFLADWADRLEADEALFIPHPSRATVAEEYEYIIARLNEGHRYLADRYNARDLERERDNFAAQWDLSTLPLVSGGLWLLPNGPQQRWFLDSWWATVNTFSLLDQAAITPLLYSADVRIRRFDVNLWSGPSWLHMGHRA